MQLWTKVIVIALCVAAIPGMSSAQQAVKRSRAPAVPARAEAATPRAGALNVKLFGAKGDGTTDDTAAMTAAHASGAVVFYPPGRYRFSRMSFAAGGIVGSGASFNDRGATGATILISDDTTAADLITFTGNALDANYPIFQDFALVLSENQKVAGASIRIAPDPSVGNYFPVFRNVLFRYGSTQIRMDNVSQFAVRDCGFQFYSKAAVETSNDSNPDQGDSSISGSSFFDHGFRGTAVVHPNSGGLRIVNNKFNAGAYGYVFDSRGTTSDTIISANSFENMTVGAIEFRNSVNTRATPVRFANIVINGNQFSDNRQDINFQEIRNFSGSSYWDNIAITGNVLYTNQTLLSSIQLGSSRMFNVSANVINGNGNKAAIGVQVDASSSGGLVDGRTIFGMKTGVVNNGDKVIVQ